MKSPGGSLSPGWAGTSAAHGSLARVWRALRCTPRPSLENCGVAYTSDLADGVVMAEGAKQPQNKGHDIIVIGTSAGGVEALPKIFSKIPATVPAAFFVVMHVSGQVRSYLPAI